MRGFNEKLFVARSYLYNAAYTRDLWYIVESANWAIRNVGTSLISVINRLHEVRASVTTTPRFIHNSVIHYGSLPTMFSSSGFRVSHPSCHTIGTIYHLASDYHKERARISMNYIDTYHTASQQTCVDLQNIGVPIKKITIIPLGIRRSLFQRKTPSLAHYVRTKLGIPEDAYVVGSFQKDGIGWSYGHKPKLEKGPDILIQVLTKASKNIKNMHVLLSGPARGYVEHELAERNIPFTSVGFKSNVSDVARLYHALDAYIITSRVEGGPLQILEAWASGVPVVSTRTGMVPDIANHRRDALISDINDVPSLAENLISLTQDQILRESLICNGLRSVRQYDFPHIALAYMHNLYKPAFQKT